MQEETVSCGHLGVGAWQRPQGTALDAQAIEGFLLLLTDRGFLGMGRSTLQGSSSRAD